MIFKIIRLIYKLIMMIYAIVLVSSLAIYALIIYRLKENRKEYE